MRLAGFFAAALVVLTVGAPAASAAPAAPQAYYLALAQLRAAAPEAEIIATGAWNFEVDRLARVDFLYRSLDKRISRAAASAGAHVADMRAIFNPRGSLAAVRARICALTFMCSQGDPHPKNAGYRAMARAFLAASGYAPNP